MWKITCPCAFVARAGSSKSPAKWMLELRLSPASAMPPSAMATAPATSNATVRFITPLLPPMSCREGYAAARQPDLRALEPADDGEPELRRALPVDHAVVERDREVAHAADRHFAVAHDRPLGDAMDAEDPDLRRVDQRRDDEAGELPRARDRERAAAQ